VQALACGGGLTIENNKSEIVGSSRYYNYRPNSKDIMIGYSFITRDYWGSTHNREIKQLMMTHMYQWVDTILFTVGANNLRSRKAMTKIGGQLLAPEEIHQRNLTTSNSVIF
jgi:RimJ/RimL family protein N-acetyltransferase